MNHTLSRREFIRQIALIAILATPVGKWLYGKYIEQQNRKQFSRLALPLIRRVYPQLMANQLVSVQPMSLPSSLIFYMDFTYRAPRPFARRWSSRNTRREQWWTT